MEHTAASMGEIIGGGIATIVFIIIAIFFIITLYTGMKQVPESKRQFPAWFCWMFLVPIANIVFQWMMIPFGIPNSFAAATESNEEAQRDSKQLFGWGLANVICVTAMIIPLLNLIAIVGALITYIVYWVKVASFKRKYFEAK